jgi:pimeloyl-ACP methyl ester carboxylesterase
MSALSRRLGRNSLWVPRSVPAWGRSIALVYAQLRLNGYPGRTICFPLYNTKPGDPDGKLRWIVNDAVSVHFFEGEGKRFDFRPALGRIACPTLVVAGAKDPRCPLPFARMIVEAIPPELVQLEVFEECGHGPHVEEPERVMDLLRTFICT